MSVNFNSWLAASASAVQAQQASRAVASWNAILDNPFTVNFFTTDGAWYGNQTMRIEHDDRARPLDSEAGMGHIRYVTLFGIRNHPTIANTVVESGWRFWIGDDEYTCLDPIFHDFEVQVTAQKYG